MVAEGCAVDWRCGISPGEVEKDIALVGFVFARVTFAHCQQEPTALGIGVGGDAIGHREAVNRQTADRQVLVAAAGGAIHIAIRTVKAGTVEADHGKGIARGAFGAEVVVVVDHQGAVVADGEAFGFVVGGGAADRGQVEQLDFVGQADAGNR